jgi:hypothetical protein
VGTFKRLAVALAAEATATDNVGVLDHRGIYRRLRDHHCRADLGAGVVAARRDTPAMQDEAMSDIETVARLQDA